MGRAGAGMSADGTAYDARMLAALREENVWLRHQLAQLRVYWDEHDLDAQVDTLRQLHGHDVPILVVEVPGDTAYAERERDMAMYLHEQYRAWALAVADALAEAGVDVNVEPTLRGIARAVATIRETLLDGTTEAP